MRTNPYGKKHKLIFKTFLCKNKVTCENEAKVGKNSSTSISSSESLLSSFRFVVVVVVVAVVDVVVVSDSSSPKSKSNWSDGIFKTRMNN